mgnify:CR=1 FL=1
MCIRDSSRALSDEIETRERSLASVKRARQKELKNANKDENKENFKPSKFLNKPKVSPVQQNLLLFEKILDTLLSPLPLLEWAVRWLNKNEPTDQDIRLSHGDLRVGNIMFKNTSLTGILDWEFASWSDPLEDIGWLCARCWRYGNDNKRVGGIGELNDFILGYDEISKRTINWSKLPYWEILATVKWALIAHQQGQRHLSDRKKRLELLLTGQKADEIEYDILTQIKKFDGNGHAK